MYKPWYINLFENNNNLQINSNFFTKEYKNNIFWTVICFKLREEEILAILGQDILKVVNEYKSKKEYYQILFGIYLTYFLGVKLINAKFSIIAKECGKSLIKKELNKNTEFSSIAFNELFYDKLLNNNSLRDLNPLGYFKLWHFLKKVSKKFLNPNNPFFGIGKAVFD